MNRVILFGAPGAGKGTQAEMIRSRFGFIKVSTGDLIRSEVESGSGLGQELKTNIENGELVPDEIIIEMVKNRLLMGDVKKGYILDGFPRTIAQAKALEQIPIDREYIFYMKIGDPEKIVGRMMARLTCTTCGATFSLLTKLPKDEGVCDHCRGKLTKRTDDQESTIRQRIVIYRRETKPVIDYFRRMGTLIEIDAGEDIGTVSNVIGGYLK